MTLTDESKMAAAKATQAGEGRPVLVIGRGFASSAAFVALARRFRVLAMETAPADIAAWVAEQGFEKLGVVGVGDAAGPALATAAAAGEAVNALVLVSPVGLPLGDADGPLKPLLKETPVAKCVLIGDGDPAARELAAYKTALSRSHVVLVFDAGSDVAAERPDAFASAAGDFLDRQGRFAFVADSVAISA
jgi:pimeloyl-ACP methyl ester carboxylesterase